MAPQVSATGAGRDGAVYTLLALAVLGITALPVGIAVFVLGFVYGDSPCVMCWEQRVGMALIALIGVFVLRYGARPKYIGLSVLVGAWGIFMGLRHTGMHAARDIGQGFSAEILGAHTYTWAVFIFWVCVLTMGLLLARLRALDADDTIRQLKPLESLATVVFLVVIAGNAVQAFASTGPPPFMGQGDPIRFSFNPQHWVWSLDEWRPAPVSLRGRWAAEKPSVASLSSDATAGPFEALPALRVARQMRLSLPLRGTPTDLAYDAASDRFLLTTNQAGIYITDAGLSHVVRYTVIDPGFSVDLGTFVGAAFVDSKTVMAVGDNKSFVVLKEKDGADANRNFRYFLESWDKFDEVSRSRFGTVRARMMYTMSAAFDPASHSAFTVTVPNAKSKRLVVSRFGEDYVLSEEYTPKLGAQSGLALKAKRKLDELYVTGTAFADGRLYAISAAYNTLLVIDPASREVVSAYSVPGVVHPVGLAVKGTDFYVLGEDGVVTVVGGRS
jgi:disulfide bond formation protein DsbB